jgi:NAD(P)H-dependent FMN reductase
MQLMSYLFHRRNLMFTTNSSLVITITNSSGVRGGTNANARTQQLLRYTGMNVMNMFVTVGNVQQIFDHYDHTTEALGNFVNIVNEK